MRRLSLLTVAALLMCLPMVGEWQEGIRYYPDGATMLTLGRPESPSIRYYPPSSTLRNGLLAYWNMDEESGDRADSSGNGYTLTDNNTVGFVAGKIGNAATPVGANTEFLSNAALNLEGRTAFSASVWFNWGASKAGFPAFVANTTAGDTNDIALVCNVNSSTTKFYCNLDDLSTKYKITDAAAVPDVATWYHLAVVYDGGLANASRVVLYLNGAAPAQSVTGTIPTAIPSTIADGIWVGRVTTNYTTAYLDEVGYWSRALTADEVTELYNAGSGKRP